MVVDNFKKITVVPTCNDFLDMALSRTQRRTPTVVHKSYAIGRIRQFYMRKVKFTQTTFHEKLSTIIDEFPRLDDVHPFYGDLLNVLYDKDHYKLALGQLNTARNQIDRAAREYVRLLKYGDSLYRCKQLKKAALGRMCSVMKRVSSSLAYLEQVRQHMSRLPSIDPNTRTILVCGYPNVGKSSFVNKITRADVEVQPYAFTTKSLFVGHTDYKYLRWQVVDTPGILDHPLEDRNTIEMLSITALAHLRAAVLFFVDVSGSCGYSIAQQAALFHSIKALFADKPLVVVCNKIDLQPLETLPEEDRQLVMDMKKEALKCGAGLIENDLPIEEDGCLVTMSAMTEEGITNVKTTACDRLLQQRVEVKLKSKKLEDCLNRLHVATPRARDAKERPPCIPEAARVNAAKVTEGKNLEKDLQEQNGGAGVYSADMHKHYILADDSWKNDVMPEIADGKNVADYYGADIVERLAELEREEAVAAEENVEYMMSEDDLSPEEIKALAAIRAKRERARQESRAKKTVAQNRSMVPRKHDKDREFTLERMGRHLAGLGMNPSAAIQSVRSSSLSRRGRKRDRSVGDEDSMEIDQPNKRPRSRSRSQSQAPGIAVVVPGEGFKDSADKMKAVKLGQEAMKRRNKLAKRGEADRVVYNLKPKHLFSGKRSMGKTQRR